MNFEEWFLSEFGQYGFSLSQTLYDPDTFVPMRLVQLPGGLRTRIKITPELSDDLHVWGMTFDHHVEALRELIRMEIRKQYGHLIGLSRDFTPTKKLTKFSFI